MSQMRTITYTVKVDTSDGKKAARDMRVTMRTMEQDSGKAEASMRKLGQSLSKDLGANVSIVKDETKTLSSSLRQSFADAKKAEKNFNQLSNEYKLLTARVGRTADQQEQLNAIYRLGSEATLTQKKRTLELVKAYQLQRNAGNKVQGSFRGMRGQMQNFGYQMQDVAVQVQMGTNAMTILSQQGSQLAAGFGPTGAVIGAGIAFAGMLGSLLIPNLLKTTDEVGTLTDTLKELSKTVGLSAEQAEILVDGQIEILKGSVKIAKSLEKEIASYEKGKQTYKEYTEQQVRLAASYEGVTRKGVQRVKTEEQFVAAQIKAEKENRKRIAQLAAERTAIEKTQKQITIYNSVIGTKGSDSQKKWEDSNKRLAETLANQAKSIAYNSVELLERSRVQDLATLADQNATDAQKELVDSAYEILIANEKRIESSRRLSIEMAEQVKRQNLLAKLDIGDTSGLDARYENERKLLAGNEKALAALREQYNRDVLLAQGTEWEKYMVRLEDQLSGTDELMMQSVDRFTAGFGEAVADAVFESSSLGDAMANIFKDVGKNMVAFFAEWAAQEAALWALKQLIGTQAGVAGGVAMTTKAEATSIQASLAAFASTAAIPIVGPALAPGAAAAAAGITQPMVAAISGLAFAGAFDKGGVIPQNQIGIVSEYGDELVDGMLVRGKAGGTRVTGREDTAKIMNNSSSNNITINSSGNVSGEAIARAVARVLKKPNKTLDTMVYDSVSRGSKNRGKRFA